MELKDFRKQLKAIGFNVKSKTYTFGTYLIFCNMAGEEIPSVFTVKELKKWIPLTKYLKKLEKEKTQIKNSKGETVIWGI